MRRSSAWYFAVLPVILRFAQDYFLNTYCTTIFPFIMFMPHVNSRSPA